MMTVNVFLSLIFQAKIKGKGLISNGKIYTKLMTIISDDNENKLIKKFNNEIVPKEAYRKLDRYLSRFIRDGKGYPYELIKFDEFEKNIGDSQKINEYLRKAETVFREILDESKTEALVYMLLEIIRQDESIIKILYGYEFVDKEKLFGTYAHPKKICAEALLIGILYHVHKNPADSKSFELPELPEKLTFKAVHFSDFNSLNPDMPIRLTENISENARHQKSAVLRYQPEFKIDDEIIYELPESKNIFLYGTGGVGKTTVLLNQTNKNSICFYFPLYLYKAENRENFHSVSCWILLNILLKYHYQYEYQTYENCCANEGEENILKQLTELEKNFKIKPLNKPKYRILLDGFNEIPSDFQEEFISELEYACREWHNVKFIISGRIIPNYNFFDDFQKIKLCGVTDSELKKILSDFSTILLNENLEEILKLPIFLNMYLETNDEFETRGELIDGYIMHKAEFSGNTEKFLIKYVLPFIANKTFRIMLRQSISRAEVMEAADEAINYYLMNENVFQNYIAPENFNKNSLRESRNRTDWIKILLNTGFLETDISCPMFMHFTHQYYQEYFAARHIVNLIESAQTLYDYLSGKLPENIVQSGLFSQWYGSFGCAECDEIYRFIGEICENNFNSLIEMSRDFKGYFTAENVIRTLKILNDNIIRNIDFSELKMPLFMCDDVTFIDCNFRKCFIPWNINSDELNFENCDFSGAFFLIPYE
ncbi:MAG: hypothetical protein IKS03_04600 [Ruminococcus sp.]|nr:hypothetical protein [Ruminococcus sp.]